jgi:hypothetical protein
VVTLHGPTTLTFGQDATFTADRRDPDDDPLTLTWSWAAGPCPGDVSRSAWPSQPMTATETFTLPASALAGQACVWAFVTDVHGATAAANLTVVPQDRPPHAQVALVAPAAPASIYPLYTTFEVSADGSTDPDGDPLVSDWPPLQGPTASTATLVPCPTATSKHRCFHADAPGTYVVTVKTTEDIGSRGQPFSDTATLSVAVAPDAIPCLRARMPGEDTLHASPGEAKEFLVGWVDDDGDPYPSGPDGETDFRWYLTDASGATSVVPVLFPSYHLPAGRFVLGDTAKVRLEIRDRDQAKMAAVFAACGDAPFCQSSPGCVQRVTWTLTFDLPGGP